MKLVAQVIAGNSAHDLVGCIEHHRNLGVDAFIICHLYSEDNTPELLQTLEREHDDITVVHIPLIFDDPLSLFQPSINLARQKYDADWILRIDSDERWFVQHGTLKEAIAKDGGRGVIAVKRYNIVWPTPAAAEQTDISSTMTLQNLPLALFPVFIPPTDSAKLEEIPWVLALIAHKCCMQASEMFDFDIGGHNVVDRVQGGIKPRVTSNNIIVAQIAFTTLDRFEIKLRGISALFNKAPTDRNPHLGWHWTRLANIYKQGFAAVEAEWLRQFMTPEFAQQLVGRQVIASGEFAFDFPRRRS
ncbi:glycosyltransferase family 2 protein [Desulfovibrio inopinatus]|uniref:glycosyltransferase family 2 protein n=1 Tax=Desulfovibrio inopinatus TaxID=102109 RepID=UPI0004130823|nr:glycosyltransferase family 2 protein [Desulfovibrio inopinatus]